MFFVDDPLHLELKAHGGQLFGGLDLHDRELLVGGGGDRELIAQRLEAVPQTESHVIGVTADVEVEIVLQQRLELYAQQPALGQHTAPLLDVPAEVGAGDRQHHGLAKQRAVLGAADGEHIRQRRQIRQCQIAFRGGEGGAKTGAVQEQQQAVLIAAVPQSGQLRLGVDGADLSGIGNVDHLRGDHVLRAVMTGQNGLHHSGSHLAVRGGLHADLVAGGFDGAGLVAVDVAGVGGDHRLIGGQQRRDDRQVGLGAADQEVNVCLGSGADRPDQVTGLLTDGVHAVAAGLDQIGVRQSLKNLGMRAFAVIVAEAVHEKTSFL